ncbi:hypothetical protein D3C87_1566630 [compost metagenome]
MECAIHAVYARCKLHHLVAVERDVRIGCPFQLAYQIAGSKRHLVSPEFDLTNVVIEVAETGFLWNLNSVKQIGCPLGVEIVDQLDPVIEKAQVQTRVELLGRFPAQVAVGQ